MPTPTGRVRPTRERSSGNAAAGNAAAGNAAQGNVAAALKARLAMSVLLVLRLLFSEAARAEAADFHLEVERRLLDLSVRRFNVVAPRGHAKSMVVAVAFVLWHVFFEDLYRYLVPRFRLTERHRAPSPAQTRKHVVLVSKTQKEAKERLDMIKMVLGDEHGEPNPLFLRLFGDWGYRTARTWREDLVVLKDGTVIRALGTAQPIRGSNKRALRITLALVDDPEDEENTKTVERMQGNIKWLFQGVIPSLDPRRGRLVVIGTPQNAQSMVVALHRGFHKERYEGGEIGSDSLWFENDEATDTSRWSVSPEGEVVLGEGETLEEDDFGRWVRKPGVLWPGWFGLTRLREEKHFCEHTDGVGLGAYYREYECKVVGDEEQVFKPDFFASSWHGSLERDLLGQAYLRVTRLRGVELAEPLVLPCVVTRGVDPAFSVSATADRTAIFDLATTYDPTPVSEGGRGEEHWELPGFYGRVPTTALLDTIARTHDEREPTRGLMEANAQQVFVVTELFQQKGIRYLHDKPVVKKKGDGSRIERIEGPMRRGTWRFWTGADGAYSPLRAELLSYPRGHDDYADAAEKAYRCRLRPTVTPDDLVLDEQARAEREAGRKGRGVRFDPMVAVFALFCLLPGLLDVLPGLP